MSQLVSQQLNRAMQGPNRYPIAECGSQRFQSQRNGLIVNDIWRAPQDVLCWCCAVFCCAMSRFRS